MKKWIYFGIFLDSKSREKLIKLANNFINDSWKIYCHHMTIAFNNNSEKVQNAYNEYMYKFGEPVEIYATHIGMSNDAIAVMIDFKPGTLTNLPHITLATPQGGKPVRSNYIENWKLLEKPIKLTGIFDEFTK